MVVRLVMQPIQPVLLAGPALSVQSVPLVQPVIDPPTGAQFIQPEVACCGEVPPGGLQSMNPDLIHGGHRIAAPRAPGAMTNAVHGDIGADSSLLNQAIERLLSMDLKDQPPLNATRMENLAKDLLSGVHEHYDELVGYLSSGQRTALDAIIARDGIGDGSAERKCREEYMANLSLFKVIRDYHGLHELSGMSMSNPNGFLALTINGSLIASQVIREEDLLRKLYYTRMPSRNRRMQTGEYIGTLSRDFSVGHGLRTKEGMRSSHLTALLLIPHEKAELFGQLRHESMILREAISRLSQMNP